MSRTESFGCARAASAIRRAPLRGAHGRSRIDTRTDALFSGRLVYPSDPGRAVGLLRRPPRRIACGSVKLLRECARKARDKPPDLVFSCPSAFDERY